MSGMRASSVPRGTLCAVAVGKMVVMPAIGAAVGLALKRSGLTGDPNVLLVAMVVTCTPTANNIVIMAELAGENKDGLAACIFVQYALAPVLLTFWLTLFVHIAG